MHPIDQDPGFMADLIVSYKPVYALANWWDYRQVPVRVPVLGKDVLPATMAKSPENKPDGGSDMLVGKKRERVEVKHRLNMRFTTVDEFPFPDVIVDVQHKIDKDGPADIYVFVNEPMTHGLFLRGPKSQKHWTHRRTKDKRLNRTRDYYVCKMRHLHALEILYPKSTIVPLWTVEPDQPGTTPKQARAYKNRIVAHNTFDGPSIAPITQEARAAGYAPALVPTRIARWNERGHWVTTGRATQLA